MGVPKYEAIENELRSEIQGGAFEPGDRFYSNTELIERFNASSITVIRAVNDLVTEGLLVRYQGKGTFVSRARRHHAVFMTEVEPFSEAERNNVSVLSLEIYEGEDRKADIVSTLHLGPAEPYCRIERLRTFDASPYQLQISYIPSRFIKPDVEPSYYESIYRRFEDDFGLQLAREASDETVKVLCPAPKRVAHMLGLAESEPCIFKEHLTLLPDGAVAECIRMYKRWDYFELRIEDPGSSIS